MEGRAEEALASTERWVLDAVAGISDALLVVDETGRLVYRNPAAERLAGVTDLPADWAAWSDRFGIFLPDEKSAFPPDQLPLVRALRGENVRDVGMYLRNPAVPEGIHILVSTTALHDGGGALRGAVCLFRDVTLIRQREVLLREAERQKKAILDNIHDIAWLKDDQGRYLVVNQPFALAVGKARAEEVIGLTDLDLWPRELAERYRTDDAEVMRTGEHKVLEEPLVEASGRQLWVETVKTRIVDDEGRVIGSTGIAHDVTERKLAADAMRSTKDELERRVMERTAELAEAQENLIRQERLAVLGQLAGGVAHQIRNPLAAIMNATYVLKRHLAPTQHENVDDAIRIIHDEVRHANIIITGLLDYARVRTPDRHPASIVELLERVVASEWIPETVRIVRNLPTADVVREVDADQLHGAISNLVRNAADAMPEGGELGVALGVVEDQIVITISDTGPGISPHVRAHLFEPLHSTKPMGIGLGLVTARRFVEAHGGRIACIDVPKGAKFEIRIPAT